MAEFEGNKFPNCVTRNYPVEPTKLFAAKFFYVQQLGRQVWLGLKWFSLILFLYTLYPLKRLYKLMICNEIDDCSRGLCAWPRVILFRRVRLDIIALYFMAVLTLLGRRKTRIQEPACCILALSLLPILITLAENSLNSEQSIFVCDGVEMSWHREVLSSKFDKRLQRKTSQFSRLFGRFCFRSRSQLDNTITCLFLSWKFRQQTIKLRGKRFL